MPIRKPLIDLLRAYEPIAQREQLCKQKILAFVQAHSDCFERSLSIGHVTASAWLLNNDHSRALLMHHTKLDKWLQLGGHCDGNPDVLAVAVKEAQEESGIQEISCVHKDIFDIDIHFLPASKSHPDHLHYDVRFLLQVIGSETTVGNSESKELRWITQDRTQLPTNEPSVIAMFDKWISLSS